MINIKTVEILKKQGYDMAVIRTALDKAESEKEAFLDGWCIKYNKEGKMIVLHPSHNGIYIGDYNTHLIFERILSFSFANAGFHKAKYRELEKVLTTLFKYSDTDSVYCECPACDYARRVKQLEKLGYHVLKTNIDKVDGISTCHFIIV